MFETLFIDLLDLREGERDKGAAVEEVLADVADRAFHLALRLGPVWAARPNAEAPVKAEAQELRVLDQPPTRLPSVAENHGLHLVKRQLGVDDLLVRIELRGPPASRAVPHGLIVQLPAQLAGRDPAVQRPPVDAELPRDRGLAHPLLQVMPQRHPRLPADHRAPTDQ